MTVSVDGSPDTFAFCELNDLILRRGSIQMEYDAFEPIPDYPMYRINKLGVIESACRTWNSSRTWKLLHPRINADGYAHIHMRNPTTKKRKAFKVASLVLSVFGSPRPRDLVCCMRNGNPRDCRLENLQWGTWLESKAIRDKLGHTARGTKNGRARLSEEDVRWIRAYWDNQRNWRDGRLEGSSAVALRFGIDPKVVRDIGKRRIWKNVKGSVYASVADIRVR